MQAIAEHLGKLSNLNLNATNITDLSPFADKILAGFRIERYFFGSGINVGGDSLKIPPMEIVEQGHEAVCNYFRELQQQGTDYLFEAKVLVLGEGGAGKSSLVRRLYFPEKDLPKEDETTRGIEIHRQDFNCSDDRNFRLNIWDFGGQQIYHATHQFFLTKNSLYVLVDDTRKDDQTVQDEGFKYWLEVIETLSDKSPVIIFQNEKGGRTKEIDTSGIKGRFSNVQQICGADLQELNSADNVKSDIQHLVQKLDHIGEPVPAKWIVVRNAIENLSEQRPFIALEEYFEIYRQHLEWDEEKAMHLSQYFHDLGVFLHFQEDRLLRRTVILQNRWATEAVFKILDDEVVKANFGRFTEEDCQRLWQESEYANKHPELLSLMEKFELCYRVPDSKDTWLSPQLLPPSRPSLLEDWSQPTDLTLRYKYDFLPKGLINRLIVRMHRFVTNIDKCWRYGAFFEYEDTQLLAFRSPNGDEIVLHARGSESKSLLDVISSDLDAINATFKGLGKKIEKRIPCICEECSGNPEPHLFEQRDLRKRKENGIETAECHRTYQRIAVSALLSGLEKGPIPKWAADPDDQNNQEFISEVKTVKLFLASSDELSEDRNEFELFVRTENDRLRKQGVYIEVVRWENFYSGLSKTRKQDDYNDAIKECDLLVSLFKTKAGTFTEEEFDKARESFLAHGKPRIWTYFREKNIRIDEAESPAVKSLIRFKKKLSDLEHFYSDYTTLDELKLDFRNQLDILAQQGHL